MDSHSSGGQNSHTKASKVHTPLQGTRESWPGLSQPPAAPGLLWLWPPRCDLSLCLHWPSPLSGHLSLASGPILNPGQSPHFEILNSVTLAKNPFPKYSHIYRELWGFGHGHIPRLCPGRGHHSAHHHGASENLLFRAMVPRLPRVTLLSLWCASCLATCPSTAPTPAAHQCLFLDLAVLVLRPVPHAAVRIIFLKTSSRHDTLLFKTLQELPTSLRVNPKTCLRPTWPGCSPA